MKLQNIVAALLASATVAGCDLFAYDNYDPPTAEFSGEITFNGEPVPVRGHVHNIAVWQIEPVYELAETTSMNVAINQDGSFRGLVYDGVYDASYESQTGPWAPDTTRRRFTINGSASLEFPVSPYYTIQNETITYNQPTEALPGGSITATFTVGQHATTPLLENVGVYIGLTNTVDATNTLTMTTSLKERTRTQIQANLTANSPITITVNLPANIHLTPSPDRRNHVFVRVGVKPVGITERIYSPVERIDI